MATVILVFAYRFLLEQRHKRELVLGQLKSARAVVHDLLVDVALLLLLVLRLFRLLRFRHREGPRCRQC